MPVRPQDMFYIIWCFLALELVVCKDPGGEYVKGIIKPNPVEIGSPMTVTCSVESIGGQHKLKHLREEMKVNKIVLWWVHTYQNMIGLADYHPDSGLVVNGFDVSENDYRFLPTNNTRDNYKVESDGRHMSLTFTVPEATYEFVTLYACSMGYYISHSDQKSFGVFAEEAIAT